RRRVLHGAAQDTRSIARERSRDDPGAAHEAVRGDDADDAVVRRRIARRGRGLLADGAGDEIGGDGRTGAAARAAGAAAGVVRVAGGAAVGAAVARGVFAHVRLGEDDGAGLAQAGDDRGVGRRPV